MTTPDAAPVTVTNDEPIDVALHETPATTTAKSTAAGARVDAAILTTQGQRRINLIWERTQAIIALSVVEVALAVGVVMIVRDGAAATGSSSPGSLAFVFLASVANLVIGFYFGRTNHTKVGGISLDVDR